jgi:preprotein translocase subunit SecA
LVEYQREAYSMFEEMKGAIQQEFVRYIYRVQLIRQDEPARPRPQRVVASHGGQASGDGGGQAATGAGLAAAGAGDKIPRNAPCPCGSGKKYKKCHGLSA